MLGHAVLVKAATCDFRPIHCKSHGDTTMTDGTSAGAEKAAVRLIVRAVELDKENRLTESLLCYQEGIGLLMEAIKGMTDKGRADAFRTKVKSYLTRAEQIKTHIATEKERGKYKEHFTIKAGTTGYSYNSVMGRFLDPDVIWVQVDDPYIRIPHQCVNFLRLCELFVLKCPELKVIKLLTGGDPEEDQTRRFSALSASLQQREIKLEVSYSKTLHDRQIRLSTGWVIKIGRGLDYFQRVDNNMSVGYFDFDLRPCQETSVDIFFSKT